MKFYANIDVDTKTSELIEICYDQHGNKRLKKSKVQPHLYFPVANNQKTEYKGFFDGKYYARKDFKTIRQKSWYKKQNKDTLNFKHSGTMTYANKYIADNYPDVIDYDTNILRKCIIDIEVESQNGFPEPEKASEKITAISIYNKNENTVVVFSYKDFSFDKIKTEYHKCVDECDLLNKFLERWDELSFDIVTGWNTTRFDIPYLYNRIVNLFGVEKAKELSPIRKVVIKENYFDFDKSMYKKYIICGIADLDYYRLYRKYKKEKQKSYKLDAICNVELGEKKLSYEEYKGLDDLYENNFERFIKYNIKDCLLIDKLENKLNYLNAHCIISYLSKTTFEDAWRPTRVWDTLIYNKLMSIDKNYVIPDLVKNYKTEKYIGAKVLFSGSGIYTNILTVDLNSLYPFNVMNFNISPETLLKKKDIKFDDNVFINQKQAKSDNNHIWSPNGCVFSDKVGIIPQIMYDIYSKRKTAKSEYKKTKEDKYDKLQYALKILLNSGYGAFGNQYFRYYNTDLAEAITTSGRIIIQTLKKNIDSTLSKDFGEDEYVIYGDTDSMFICCDNIIKKKFGTLNVPKKEKRDFLLQSDKYIQNIITNNLSQVSDYFNIKNNTYKMEREKIINKIIICGKKNYIYDVIDNEGCYYDKPKIKYSGVQIKKNTMTDYISEKLKCIVEDIIINNINENDVIQRMKDFYHEFKKQPLREISQAISSNKFSKYSSQVNGSLSYVKGAPIQVRSGIIYNIMIKNKKLEKKYRTIENNSRVKYLFLKIPNPIGYDVIGFPSDEELPKEFGLLNYINYEKMFERGVVTPLRNIVSKIGWKLKFDIDNQSENIMNFME